MTLTTVNGKPIETPAQAAADLDKLGGRTDTPTPQGIRVDLKPTHRKECGDVGETGEHGDLGSNAADAEKGQAK